MQDLTVRLAALILGVALGPTAEAADLQAFPFELKDVRLLDGPLLDATKLDAQYLLALEPDRLLAKFRVNAGLKPKAENYGGWEDQGVAGHSLGHYLSACALMFASTGNEDFKRRADYIVDELAACQQAGGDGLIAAFPRPREIFDELSSGDIRSQGFDLNGCWVPLYTLHKAMAGLRDAYRLCDNQEALEIEVKLIDWIHDKLNHLDDNQMQTILACEHGGINETVADLYADTGQQRYLDFSRRLHHKSVLDPLAARQDHLAGLHGNTQIPKLVGVARRYELDGDPADRTTAEFFWERVVNHHSYVTGGHSLNEHFAEPDQLNDRLGPNTTESCNVYNMLKLTRHVFGWNPSAHVADFYERALLNHILSSQHPDDGRVIYYLSLEMGGPKTYQSQFDGFTCCVGTGMENHAKYGKCIYFHGEDSLYVNLFVASELTWREKGLTLRQETRFPDDDTTRLEFGVDQPVSLAVRIRYPYWAQNGVTVRVNGDDIAVQGGPSSYITIDRTWNDGDVVELTMPMSLRLEAMPDNPDRVAVMYGPMVLAGELGPTHDPAAESPDYVPVLLVGDRQVNDWVKPVVGRTNTFRTVDAGQPRDVTLIPFYRMHDRRYSVYWDRFTPEQWAERQAEYEAEQERLRELQRITVDVIAIGEMQSERDHNLQGEKTDVGPYDGRKWRHSVDGGWFSFELDVSREEPTDLVCTYWGSESGLRTFDILIDDVKLATQTLNQNKPGEFFDEVYPLPEEMTEGKGRVTVRLQAHPDNFAGGLFGCRTVRRDRIAP